MGFPLLSYGIKRSETAAVCPLCLSTASRRPSTSSPNGCFIRIFLNHQALHPSQPRDKQTRTDRDAWGRWDRMLCAFDAFVGFKVWVVAHWKGWCWIVILDKLTTHAKLRFAILQCVTKLSQLFCGYLFDGLNGNVLFDVIYLPCVCKCNVMVKAGECPVWGAFVSPNIHQGCFITIIVWVSET